MLFAKVAVGINIKTSDGFYTYEIPEELSDKIEVGQIVLIPFRNKKIAGLVLEITETKPLFATKKLEKIILNNSVPNHLLKIINFISDYYITSYGSALSSVIPLNLFTKNRRANPAGKEVEKKITNLKILTPDQSAIFNVVKESLDGKSLDKYLIFGVTGSGKTEIYAHLIDEVIKKGKHAIVLVPEISLTPQTFNYFNDRFPDKVALWHSDLKETEKHLIWQEIRSGKKTVVVGSRSAIFSPLANLGIIIIDEEQESSFKQDQSPRYHARTVAKEIAAITKSILVLGSATPSIDAYSEAITGKYKLLRLPKRVTENKPPKITIVDLKDEFRNKNYSPFSSILQEKMEEALVAKKQIMLFLNRRGASTYILCKDCGWVYKCPACDIPFTYHLDSNKLICHHCTRVQEIPTSCFICKSYSIKYYGKGTQKIEYELNKLFPKAIVKRMDKDSTSKRGSHGEIYQDFLSHKIDILIGTQMIAKGWDIGNVSLVGVINADNALYLPDFRAEEKTHQLLVQVSGRAGRKKGDEGEVVIQTYCPDNLAIVASAKYDTENFYNSEVSNRKKHNYPPFAKFVKILYNNEDKNTALKNALKDFNYLHGNGINVEGPIPSFIPKINNKYRYILILKFDKYIKADWKLLQNVSGSIDVDPTNLLN
ncbi:MAG: primosomal protein N', primosomal protein N' [candidate division CPR2 bacterium GW2011_GWC1_39_9]|uniref:Replication restart protein PriA n=1 Tax=candidate division CPR2 bacterium GW2011_GWC2_39_10 TaxID=1618345 RepID=A0A0G0M1X7_UNCC2|nr:MAG: Primosome assembly protein PriA [candidate division CPR2 bacterium GW2011_GWC2_39_10]KKR36089.1 MAG: primosomal protein N', primosomal protein N' [candidate division CPR2 bacterium GW2011_GWC1_39_9]